MTATSPLRVGALVRASAVAVVVALVALPLVGLLGGVLDPTSPLVESPFDAAPAASQTLGERLAASGAGPLLATTAALALLVAALAVPLGTWLAWVEQRASYRGAGVLALLDLLPLAVPSYLLAATVREAMGPSGLVGAALGLGTFRGFGAAVLVLTVVATPHVQLLVGAVLARSSASEEEAARTLGARGWSVFRVAVLPRLRPAIAFSFLVTLLYVMADFGAVAVLDTPVLTWRLYQAVNQQQLARAALLGLSLLALALPLVVASRVLHGRDGGRRSVANPRPVARRPLGRVAAAATAAAHVFVIGFGVVVPLVTLVGWVRGGMASGRTFAPLGEPLLHSTMAAGAGAVVTVALAAPVAWAVARAAASRALRGVRSDALSSGGPSTWSGAWPGAEPRGWPGLWRRLEDGVYLTSALPGVLLAFGLLLAALMASRAAARSGLAASSGAVYQALLGTGALLIAGYGARFLAEAYAPLRNAVGGLDPRWQETARTLGASARRRFTALTVPALAPGTSVAFVLVVLAIVKELPVTLLLGGAMGLKPLAFRIYDRYQEAFLHDAGAAGLVLMVLSLATLAATLRWRRHV